MRVCEIFKSIQGESSFAGYPFIFIRFSGCNLRCSYCDTTYAYEEGFEITEEKLLKKIEGFGIKSVTITGGEPLLQKDVFSFVDTLIRRNYRVLVETNGTLDISQLNKKAIKIIDLKCPGSGESEKNNWENLNKLTDHDEIKFVVTNREDYEWAKWICNKFSLFEKVILNFSPAHSVLKPNTLASWILEDNIPVRLNLQLHRYIWKHRKRGV
jgi:7-carboxy-7-deazaguanine synthase